MLSSWVWSLASQKSLCTSRQKRVVGWQGLCIPCTMSSGSPSNVFAPGTSSSSTRLSIGLKCSCGARAVLGMVERILGGGWGRGSCTNHKGYLGITCCILLSSLWPAICHQAHPAHFRNAVKGSSKIWAKPIAVSQWAGARQHHLRALQRKLSWEAYKSEVSTDYLFLSQSILKRWVPVKSPNKEKAKIQEVTSADVPLWALLCSLCCSTWKHGCVARSSHALRKSQDAPQSLPFCHYMPYTTTLPWTAGRCSCVQGSSAQPYVPFIYGFSY